MTQIHLAENWALEMAKDCEAATHSIVISALSLHEPRSTGSTPFHRLWAAWQDAAARGCLVGFYLAAPSKVHPATAHNIIAAQHAFARGIKTRFIPQPNLMHAKSCIIDREICWVGSGNMTAAAAHHNHEMYVRFESVSIAARILTRWQAIANPV